MTNALDAGPDVVEDAAGDEGLVDAGELEADGF
jgi:hypothetical protein